MSSFTDLFEKKEFFDDFLGWVPIACGIFDAQGAFVACNENWSAFFCIDRDEAPVLNFCEFLPAFQPCGTDTLLYLQKNLGRAAEFGFSKFEFQCHAKDMTELYVDMYAKPAGSGLFVVLATFASQKAIEAETKRLAAEEESKAKTRFLARMSHEIRTPMNAVMGITEMQLSKGGHAPETAEAFARIYNSSNMLISIINDILDFSKVEAGKMDITPAPYNVASLLVDTVQLNLMYIGSKSVKFELNVDPAIPSQLVGDQLRIRQVLNNLLSNAFKYTTEGSVKLDAWHMPASDEQATLFFRVQDTGQGMTDEQLSDIFRLEFTRFNTQMGRFVEGTGLGMSIAKSLVRLMGGIIRAHSEIGVGTSFTVEFPHKIANATPLGEETVANLQNFDNTERALRRINQMRYTPMPYGKVLVVDDVESNLYVAKGLLMPYKLTIETADSGYEAVEKIKDGNVYDVIFMAHMMPGMSGMEAVKIIREHGYDGAIIALTANTIVGQSEMYLANGFSGFVSKPIDINQLNANLLKFIRDRQPQEVIEAAGEEYVLDSERSFAASEQTLPYAFNEANLSMRVLESFVKDAERSISALSGVAFREGLEQAKIYIVHVHALRSALGNIGERSLSQIAACLEQAAKDGDGDTVEILTPAFLRRLVLVKDEIQAKTGQLTEVPALQPASKEMEASGMRTVFAVDDSDTNLVLVEEALEEHFTVVTVPSAMRLFELLERISPELVLLDVEMPVMNGYAALEELRANPKTRSLKVAFMTATVTQETREASEKHGVMGIVSKPFDSGLLLSKVTSWVESENREPTILIVDDTPMIISALTRILSPHYKVKAAKDGESGLRIAQGGGVDLVLLDISMPKMSGFGVIERLKANENTESIPVIFITASSEAEDEATGFALGAVDYIKKPFTQESVLHRVRLHIDKGGSF